MLMQGIRGRHCDCVAGRWTLWDRVDTADGIAVPHWVTVKFRCARSDAYSAEQVLLNKPQIYCGAPKLDCYPAGTALSSPSLPCHAIFVLALSSSNVHSQARRRGEGPGVWRPPRSTLLPTITQPHNPNNSVTIPLLVWRLFNTVIAPKCIWFGELIKRFLINPPSHYKEKVK